MVYQRKHIRPPHRLQSTGNTESGETCRPCTNRVSIPQPRWGGITGDAGLLTKP